MHPLVTKLSFFSPLSDEDVAAIENTLSDDRTIDARHVLMLRESFPDNMYALKSGLACRFVTTKRDRRQILSLAVPGDACDYRILTQDRLGYSIQALSDCTVTVVSRAHLDMVIRRPAIARAMTLSSLADRAILMQRVVSLGQRDSAERIAHLLCEMRMRSAAVGLVTGDTFALPLALIDLAEVTGLSIVTANRALQQLRSEGVIAFGSGIIEVLDNDGLERVALFDEGDFPQFVNVISSKAAPLRVVH